VNATDDTRMTMTLLRDMREALFEIRDKLAQTGEAARSSVEISTSARGNDVKVKCYADSDVYEAANQARDEYARMMRELAQLQLNNWGASLADLSAR
jgi:hypothetical protein